MLSGHSLGAGVVVLLSLDLLHGELASSLPQSTEVRCYAFAPPPVYRPGPDSDELPDCVRDKIVIVINNHDCIPRTSLGEIETELIKISFFRSARWVPRKWSVTLMMIAECCINSVQ